MILEFYDAALYLNGQTLPQSDPFYLTPVSHHEYQKIPDLNNYKEDQQSVFIDTKKLTIDIRASWHGERPLYYKAATGFFALSSSFESLLDSIHKHGSGELKLDRIAILESMIFDHPFRSRTLFEDIRQATSGQRIRFDGRTSSLSLSRLPIWTYDQGTSPEDENIYLGDAIDIISGLIRPREFDQGSITLPLSGGHDSRLLACLLKKQNIPFNSVTFSPPGGTELYIAKKVARQLGTDTRYLELKDEYYKTYGDEVTWLTGGLSNHRHCHLYACLAANQVYADKIVHGFFGDVYSGKPTPPVSAQYGLTRDQAFNAFLAREKIAKNSLWKQMPPEDKQAILSDLDEVMDENLRTNLPCHFQEYFHLSERHSSLTANLFAPIEKFGTVIYPFASKDFFKFFHTLPYPLKKSRNLFMKACLFLFPAVFEIGRNTRLYNQNTLLGRMEPKIDWWLKRISFATLYLTQGRFVIRYVKTPERHRELLATTLKNDMRNAIPVVGDFLNLDLSGLSGIRLSNFNDKIFQYRGLSLFCLMEQLKTKGYRVSSR